MNSLKMSVFTLALSFSMGALAADNIDRNSEKDSVFDSSRDCMGLTGADRALCETEMKSDSTDSKANENSRIDRNRSTNMRDDVKSRDLNTDLNTTDLQFIDNQDRDTKPSSAIPSSTIPSSATPSRTIPSSTVPNNNRSSNNRPSNNKPDNVTPRETEANGTQLDGSNTRKSTADKYKFGNTSNPDIGAGSTNSSTSNSSKGSSSDSKPK